ncbi:hypothetical protein V6N12_037372 [Hibiscus sabdariffa]|uniref:Uncharacterized protein n=1 Tax=Hibiscus sabdariffa TaxID=183260 RepID=A0ABR2BZ28_9ROSI
MAESLLAKLGDLNFTAEEQDAVVVVPETVAIPAEDFACSLVGRVLSSGPLDGGRVARLFRTIWKDDKDADLPPLSPAPSVASSPPASVSTIAASVPAPATTDVAASVPASAASVGLATSVPPLAPGYDATVPAPLPAHSTRDNVHVACDNEAPYDPMLHRDVSDAMEDSLDVPNGCTLFSDLDGMV